MKISSIYLYLIIVFFISCGVREKKFDKTEWNIKDDMFYANREGMVNDLMQNYLRKGMTYKDVIDLLGQTYYEQNILSYEITVDYGWNIDPQKGKTLYIVFSKDSTVQDFRLEKWEH